MKVKPWQIAVIVVGLLVGLGSAVYSFLSSSGPKLDRRYTLIDVETGELFEVDSEKLKLMSPARHPDTGKIKLLAVAKDEKGAWYVPGRELQLLSQLESGVEVKAIDPETGDLKGAPGAPKPYVKKW